MSESKWELQISNLVDAYLAWKDGSSVSKTTGEEFAVQYVNIFGEYCLLYPICHLIPLRLPAVKDVLSCPRVRLRILKCYSPSPWPSCADSRQDLNSVFTMNFGAVRQATTMAPSTFCPGFCKGHL